MPLKRQESQNRLTCRICARESVKDGYCEFHSKAAQNVVRGYETWKRALGITWKEYLREIVKNVSTGQWAREVAEHIMKNGEEPHV
jgi:hypothetical protein